MVVHQELDCFLAAAASDRQHPDHTPPQPQQHHSFIDLHQVLAAAPKKISFDVALDTDDLDGAKNKSLFHGLDLAGKKSSVRKIALCDCRRLLKKKLVDNRHTKWIQRQWEKHCGNPARIKDKLIAKNFLCRKDFSSSSDHHHLSAGEHAAMASRGWRKLPMAYSFISFKAGISTVDFKTKFLPADCVQMWKRWKVSKSLPLPFRRNSQVSDQASVEAPLIFEKDNNLAAQLDREGGGTGSMTFQDLDTVATDCSCELFMVEQVDSGSDPMRAQVQECDLGFGIVSTSSDTLPQGEREEEHCSNLESETTSAASHVEQDEVAAASTSSSTDPSSDKQDDRKAPAVAELNASARTSSTVAPDVSICSSNQAGLANPDNFSRGRTMTRDRSTELTTELSKYILFRELLRRMPVPDLQMSPVPVQASSSSKSEGSASVDGPQRKEAPSTEPSRKAAKGVLSPYRSLFEDRNRELLQELLTSLSDEAQLIRQAWNCNLHETAVDQAATSSSATAPSTPWDSTSQASKSSEKEKERVSLFLSLKDGKIQLKEKPKEEMRHDSLSKVVKQHGMKTGFYMKITREELLKKLPPRPTRTRARSVPLSRGRATTLQRLY